MQTVIRRALIFWLLIAIVFAKPLVLNARREYRIYFDNVQSVPVNDIVDQMPNTTAAQN